LQLAHKIEKQSYLTEHGFIVTEKKKPDPTLDTILNSIADGVFTIDLDQSITSFNKAAELITGISRKQAIGQKCFDVFHANICQGSCAMEKTMKTGKPIIDLRINIINSDGKIMPVSVSTAVLKDAKGRVVGGVETFRDLSAIEEMRKEIARQYSFQDIVSKHHEIQKIFSILPDIAKSGSTVLIQGPSGSGKELFARAIHNQSNRSRGPYVVVNCGALPETLLESELFGYVKGAFTDAKQDKPGRFARAEGGTLFLDEIGDLPVSVQVKLLRVVQNGEYEPLGATKPVKSNVRIIAATHQNLPQLLAQGKFREDLYYRLNVIKITLPPLTKRREDIPLLVDHFIHKFNIKMAKRINGVSPEVMDFFMMYDFPGNIRELENIIEHAFVLCRDAVITMEHLPQDVKARSHPIADKPSTAPLPLEEVEARIIADILRKHNGNRQKAARELGMDRTTLWRKMKKLGVAF
jgi:PAS domain S-box-containing protein